MADDKFHLGLKMTTFYLYFSVETRDGCLNQQLSEATMLELLKSLLFAVVMVPVVMAIILGLIYGLGEVFNVLSKVGHSSEKSSQATQQK
ncbi:hypothetical protein AWC35_05220 [Gibbsiella quercinecans]|uniref:Multidrug efflux pump accessory protein AcrZ n=2 Tax=Gibbsiella quercinecans TaxID=929813 RepID=A0A250AY19_9GAMM|nr:hypothetical protein AWC35_05220 [Gibbsiella quercinecans]